MSFPAMSQEGQSADSEDKDDKSPTFDCVWVKQEVKESHTEEVEVKIEPYIVLEEMESEDAEKRASGNEEASHVESVAPRKRPRKSAPRIRKRRYACDHCSYSSHYKNCLEVHMAGHSEDRPFSCKYCDYTTRYMNSLDRHITTIHYESEIATGRNVPVYSCDKCEYTSFSKWNLRSHKRKHSEKIFKCNMCPFSTSYKHNLLKHSRTHKKKESDNLFKCVKCPFETKYEGHIQRHMIKIHNENITLAFRCERCEFSTIKKWRLKVHVMNNKTEFAVHCTSCDFESFFKCEMKKHNEGHIIGVQRNVEAKITRGLTGIKPVFKCPKCEFQIKNEGLFYKHLAEEHNEQTQQEIQLHCCQYCDYSAREIWRIKTHQQKSFHHTPVKCEFCGYRSSFRCNIRKHKNEHCRNHQRVKSDTDKHVYSENGDVTDNFLLQEGAIQQINYEQIKYPRVISSQIDNHHLNNQQNNFQETASQQVADQKITNPQPDNTQKDNQLLNNYQDIQNKPINNQQIVDDKQIDNQDIKYHQMNYQNFNYDKSTAQLNKEQNITVDKNNKETGINEKNNEEPLKNYKSMENNAPIPNVSLVTEKTDLNEQLQLSYQQTKHGKDNNYLIDTDCVDYRNIQVLGSGKREREKESSPNFQCHLCDYTSKYKASVQRHFQRNHTSDDNKPYKCINCSFSTKTKDQIALHNKRSKSGFEITCNSCDFKTIFKCALHDHEKQHFQFRCEFCSYSCRTKYDLSKHFSIKHLEFRLQCQYCDYKTGRKESLVYHETIHTGQKPYKCQECSYSAVRKGTVFSHFRKCHPDKNVYDVENPFQIKESTGEEDTEPLDLEDLQLSRNSLDEILDQAKQMCSE